MLQLSTITYVRFKLEETSFSAKCMARLSNVWLGRVGLLGNPPVLITRHNRQGAPVWLKAYVQLFANILHAGQYLHINTGDRGYNRYSERHKVLFPNFKSLAAKMTCIQEFISEQVENNRKNKMVRFSFLDNWPPSGSCCCHAV